MLNQVLKEEAARVQSKDPLVRCKVDGHTSDVDEEVAEVIEFLNAIPTLPQNLQDETLKIMPKFEDWEKVKSPKIELKTLHSTIGLKKVLVTTPILQSPDRNLPFEVMYDASDYVFGAVLGQKKDKKMHTIYYASKTIDVAQANYGTKDKELLVVVFDIEKFSKIHPPEMTPQQKKKFFSDMKKYIRDDPYLYRLCGDGIYRRCVLEEEVSKILSCCHSASCGGHAIDYVLKWVEATSTPQNDAKMVIKLFTNIIFTRFGVPRLVISDEGSHFMARHFDNLLNKYGVSHRVGTPYRPQTSGQLEVSNREIKSILEKTVSRSRKDWSSKHDDALWAYHTTYITPIRMSPFRFIYDKPCHLLVELEHKAYWAVKLLNFDLKVAGEKRKFQQHELEELWLDAYENARTYKERIERWQHKHILRKEFRVGELVLLFNS
ncbi:PREDICTED: uncharacterized protein LOC109337545 [Lupinus angustifolius]|uniref:uncharacterized protein LOC109337545 n=1 Tax=Lupinus angustifolius TaxID=3871 RepID=UPI00092F56CB|nr:PREDICTED: uncharacterized protein LOC109337545 [Lupinus angustifolius]